MQKQASNSDNLSTTNVSFHIEDRKIALFSQLRNKALSAQVTV
jgi:hypothetical protein